MKIIIVSLICAILSTVTFANGKQTTGTVHIFNMSDSTVTVSYDLCSGYSCSSLITKDIPSAKNAPNPGNNNVLDVTVQIGDSGQVVSIISATINGYTTTYAHNPAGESGCTASSTNGVVLDNMRGTTYITCALNYD